MKILVLTVIVLLIILIRVAIKWKLLAAYPPGTGKKVSGEIDGLSLAFPLQGEKGIVIRHLLDHKNISRSYARVTKKVYLRGQGIGALYRFEVEYWN